MKIATVNFEIIRATSAVAEFLARVNLEGNATGCMIAGSVTGPTCAGISTVELAYPMVVVDASDTAVSLRCIIPEPNLWATDSPYRYAWLITLEKDGTTIDQRAGSIVLKG